MTSSIKHIIYFLLLIAQPVIVVGQSKVIIVTRKIEQKWEAKSGSKLFIKGEKAKIIIEQSNTGFIEVQLKLKAKHANVEISKKELKYLRYNLNKSGHEYYLNNQILLPANISQPEARLEAEYILKVPIGCEINIENNLGDIRLKNLNNAITINIEYGNVLLNSIEGYIDIRSNIGDISAIGIAGELKIQSEYSEIRMDNISGKYNLQTRYGNLEIISGTDLNKLIIDSYKTDVYLLNKTCKEYNLDIETQFGEIIALQTCYLKEENLVEKVIQKSKITDLKYRSIETLPEIAIKSKFAVVELR